MELESGHRDQRCVDWLAGQRLQGYLYLVEQPFERQTTVPLPFSPRISLVPPAF